DRHLVASSRAQPCEVGIERMVGTTRVMRRFTEHRTQLRRPALGDPPVRVAFARLVGRGHEPGVARRVLGIGKALYLGEDGNRRGCHDGSDTGNRLQTGDLRGKGLLLLARKRSLERADLLPGATPQRTVLLAVGSQLLVLCQSRDYPGPARLAPKASTQAPQTGRAQQRLDGTDLRGLQPHEMATARKRVAQTRDLLTWNVDDRTVDPPPQTLTELQSVTPIALLVGPVCLEPHLVSIDHDGIQPQSTELTGDEERYGPGLQCDPGSARKPIGRLQLRKPFRRRRHLALRDHLPPLVLDHERTLLAVNVQSNVVGSHRAAPPFLWGSSSDDPVVRREPYRGSRRGSPSSLIQLGRPLIPTNA